MWMYDVNDKPGKHATLSTDKLPQPVGKLHFSVDPEVYDAMAVGAFLVAVHHLAKYPTFRPRAKLLLYFTLSSLPSSLHY